MLTNTGKKSLSKRSFHHLETSLKGHVQTLTFTRPKMHNAMSMQMGEELIQGILASERDPDIRALVITGQGPSFSSGRDLKASKSHSKEEAQAYMQMVNDSVMAVKNATKPVIAGVLLT